MNVDKRHTQASSCGLGFLTTWQVGAKKQPGRDYIAFYDLILGAKEGLCPYILFIGTESLSPAHCQGEGNQNPHLNEI